MMTRGTFPAPFVSGDTLTAAAFADGSVHVMKTSGATTTLVGSVTIPTTGPGLDAGYGWRPNRHAAPSNPARRQLPRR